MIVDHTKNIIEVTDVSFSYGERDVLKDVNLNIHEGDYLGLIGPNGSGKTTLLKLMLGLLKADKGEIKLFGTPIKDFKDWKKVGYVPQKVTSFDPMFPITAREVVGLGKDINKERENINWALEKVEMEAMANRMIGELSGGQQQRIFIARALAQKPQVLFLDEPTSGVDADSQKDFYAFLDKINKKLDITLVLVSHDMDVVKKEVTEIAYVNKKLTFYDDPKKFLEKNKK